MKMPLFVLRWMHRRRLSRGGLRGGWLHRWLGDRILAKELWRPSRTSLARGWLVAFPITMMPFLPVQSVFACVAAVWVRGNLLLCIALQFLSTPLTAPLQVPACYLVGAVMLGESPAVVWRRLSDDPDQLWSAQSVETLYLGALVLGVVGGLLGYGIIQRFWRERPVRRPPGAAVAAPAAAPTSVTPEA